MRLHTVILFIVIWLSGCTLSFQELGKSSTLICDMYDDFSAIDFDEMSSEVLRSWVQTKYPNSKMSDYSYDSTAPYNYVISWEDKTAQYFANYHDEELVNIQIVLNQRTLSGRNIIECLGEPYYSSMYVAPIILIYLYYPEKGISISASALSEHIPGYDETLAIALYIARPSSDLDPFFQEVTPFANENDSIKGIMTWPGTWDAMQVFKP